MSKTIKVRIKKFEFRPKHWCVLGEMDHLMGESIELKTDNDIHYYAKGYAWEFLKSDFEEQVNHESPDDKQVDGSHYTSLKLEPWEIIDRLNLDFWDGNALKYLIRHGSKNGIEDLKKAIHYIEKKISILEKK